MNKQQLLDHLRSKWRADSIHESVYGTIDGIEKQIRGIKGSIGLVYVAEFDAENKMSIKPYAVETN